MRFDMVQADAFGPFSGERLELPPGFSVLHGPNEAGKSSWVAALYAGLTGRRRSRGRGTREQVAFTQRHKPWRGRRWQVGVQVTLDDGTTLQLHQNLATGDTRIVDVISGRPVTVQELERRYDRTLSTEGGFDGARLLGLTRDSARATIFVGQADILRVLEDADSLQEFLQRAATSEGRDSTAEIALLQLAELRKEQVGVMHTGSRPLRTAQQRREQARGSTLRAEDHHHEVLRLLTERQGLDAGLRTARAQVGQLEAHARWLEIEELEQRLTRIAEHREAMSALGSTPPPAPPETIHRAQVALATREAHPDEPAPLEGTTSEQLQAELEALPVAEAGDTEVHTSIRSAREAVQQGQVLLEDHEAHTPTPVPAVTSPLEPSELLTLADTVAAPAPTDDAGIEERARLLEAEHLEHVRRVKDAQRDWDEAQAQNERARESYEQELERYAAARPTRRASEPPPSRAAVHAREPRSRSRMLVWSGLAVLVAGIALLLADVVLGAVVATVGLLLAGVGAVASPRTSTATAPGAIAESSAPEPKPSPLAEPAPPTRPDLPDLGPRPEVPGPPPELARLRTELEVLERDRAAYRSRVENARTRLAEHSLEPDPAHLRRMAADVQGYEAHVVALATHARRRREIEEQVRRTAPSLVDAVVGRDPDVPVPGGQMTSVDALQVAEAYERRCRDRASKHREAARRQDLARALESRLQQEDAHRTQQQAAQDSAAEVQALVTELGLAGRGRPGPVALEAWVNEQEGRRQAYAERERLAALLGQLLGQDTEEHLQQRLVAAHAAAGDRPTIVVEDVSAELEAARAYRDDLSTRHAALSGAVARLCEDEPDVASAREEEAAAERLVARVQTLDDTLGLAISELQHAKERAHADLAPALRSTMQGWLSAVTGGHYVDLRVDPADLEIELIDSTGAPSVADRVSHGTTEQTYLLLRLALAHHLSDAEEKAPLVLDDVTVQSDETRTVAILDLLAEQATQRQVILFTQEREVVDWAEKNLTGDRDALIPLTSPVLGTRAG